MTLSMTDLNGLFTAIVTPFTPDRKLDKAALTKLVEFQIASGASGIVPIGGTGEYTALSRQERAEMVAICVEAAGGKPVIPGVLSTGFEDAVEAGKNFKTAGASGLMPVTPYYATGPQEGMRAYFKNYRDAVDLPLVLYQIPRRTNVELKAETVQALAEDGVAIGIKYSNYDMPEFLKTVKFAGDKMSVLSGEEPLFATHVALGARGGVLATATIYPERWIKVFEIARQGKLAEAVAASRELDMLIDVVFRETNPGPLKKYMEIVGMPVGSVRLPLTDPSEETVALLKETAQLLSAAEAA
ncbi:4-hydroxy-tetrahydrodipicolinate synthase [Rhodobium orientis]|uniref:4-hydroxy-tetrahydrodipicolinate synthase n=1 Tax=Rhodobium orientis TaxID=34017 RepID=A0A327JKP5_9HYPH|nr:4-hydroxy-tetrahydrodipicolinate synthase [Rhodobium orientis]MBB4301637.1 4-hydroxy-tetrahydrodipicolinate synthase [Rhodobium orientis]MBK5952334.1 4-hydroxy-tetrahydrodipicolinate synthase [Rhodobium orientis]RAI25402.1 4-hydroxy-tetrahydrodipicolinate synthase [Rhodobium orientis]